MRDHIHIPATLTELAAEIADTVLENMHYANVTAPQTLYTHDKETCLLYTSPSPRDGLLSRMPSSA